MTKKLFLALALIGAMSAADMIGSNAETTCNACYASTYDRNADGYIYKGTIRLTRVASGIQDTFYLFNKGGVDYVAVYKSGPYYRLAHRMTINNIDYKL